MFHAARITLFSGGVPYDFEVTSVPLDPLIGQTLDGRYVIRSRIARGGMAMVYLANDLRLERKVAVKVMHEHLAEDENFTRRFDREARSAAKLSHANLVNVFDQGHDLGRTYLVMEYLPNMTLREVLKRQKRLSLDEALEISDAILSGLSAAHTAGIVHRDLKPENVLLVDDGRIKIGDFGLARAVSANTTTGQALLGTIAYLSPELVTRGVADERSDLYAFGIMLYEMLTGTQPFVGEQPMQIAYQHAHSDVPAPSGQGDVSTPLVDGLVVWLTQRDPAARPADAREALERLSEIRRDPWGEALGAPLPTQATQVLPGVTTVLPDAAFADIEGDSQPTPSTTVLDGVQQASLATPAPAAGPAVIAGATGLAGATGTATVSAVDTVTARGTRRAKRGRGVAFVLTALIAATSGLGFWFGQGGGSQVTVPEVSGMSAEEAASTLKEASLTSAMKECSSLTVSVGLVSESTPAPGDRVDRGTPVTLCVSTGPALLAVPTLVGLKQDAAIQTITDGKFTFGKVIESRFSDAPADQVLAALDADGNELGTTFPEQGVINLVLSAGSVPSVTGLPAAEAKEKLAKVRLTVDESLHTSAYSDDIAEGSVLGVNWHTDPVRPGDSVGLQLSLGPELFEVPDVAGMPLREAMATLRNAGFSPTTLAIESFWDLAKATKTIPEAGSKAKSGAEITVRAQLSL